MCKYCNVYAKKFHEYNFCPMCSERLKDLPFISKYKVNKKSCFINKTQNINDRSFRYRD